MTKPSSTPWQGEKLEIKLVNKDEMPHNLILIEEGKLQDFGAIGRQIFGKP